MHIHIVLARFMETLILTTMETLQILGAVIYGVALLGMVTVLISMAVKNLRKIAK